MKQIYQIRNLIFLSLLYLLYLCISISTNVIAEEGVLTNVHEDSSTALTHKLPSVVEFPKKSNDDLLTIPVKCTLGKDCWISNLPEHSKNNNLGFDYHCNKKTYSSHSGTDFAIQDMKAMKDGVDVISPIDGRITRLRDGVDDINVKKLGLENLEGKDCGNAVAIARGDYEYLLCHMKEFSLVVQQGQEVKRGQKIGQIGLSGRTEYPHLHITARKKDIDGNWNWFDPFYNKGTECGATPDSMWLEADALEKAAIKSGIVYNYGFSYNVPTAEKIATGDFREIKFTENPNMIIGWVEIFSTNPGDQLLIRLHDPINNFKIEQNFTINKYQAKYMRFIGKKLRNPTTISKELKLEIEYIHKDGTVDKYTKLLSD